MRGKQMTYMLGQTLAYQNYHVTSSCYILIPNKLQTQLFGFLSQTNVSVMFCPMLIWCWNLLTIFCCSLQTLNEHEMLFWLPPARSTVARAPDIYNLFRSTVRYTSSHQTNHVQKLLQLGVSCRVLCPIGCPFRAPRRTQEPCFLVPFKIFYI